MRALLIPMLAGAVLLQAGCDRAAKTTAEPAKPAEAVTPAASTRVAPAAAPVAPPAGKFDAISNTAMGVTGDLTASGGTFTFSQGQTYALEGVASAKGSDSYAVTKVSFASLINVPDAAELKVLRVAKEDPAKARNGGFCGKEPATFLVTHEGVDGSGGPAMFIMAFKGAAPPSSSMPETDLCGTFMYAPATK